MIFTGLNAQSIVAVALALAIIAVLHGIGVLG
jgi:hypothetical protein